MDEKKKWEERAQVGPYQIEEQMPHDPDSPGELYMATHEETGATALVLKPAASEDAAPLPDFRVEVIASQEEDYLALEVKDTRRARAPDMLSADALMPLLGDVHDGVGRMARALDGPEEPRPMERQGFALAGVAAVCTLLFALVRLVSGAPLPSGSESLAGTPTAAVSPEEPTANEEADLSFRAWLADTEDAGTSAVTRPLPDKPFKGQKRPPCKRPSETELVGGCWAEHAIKAPCPEDLYEYQGKCYIPAYSAKSQLPQSLDQ
jgi:hypothetical protein